MTTQALPKVRKSTIGCFDQTKEEAWLQEHRHEHVGQWVVLDGERLVGHDADPRPLVAQARAEGVQTPFVEFVRDESEPFMGSWL